MEGNFARALELHDQLMPLHEALGIETNPGPVKYAASVLGLCKAEWRLPLSGPLEESRRVIDNALRATGLLLPQAANA
jgi:4-hydroxy-tetrahydrodipicolinate synthase